MASSCAARTRQGGRENVSETIFLVCASRGEYSDRSERRIVAFTDKAAAEKFVLDVDHLDTAAHALREGDLDEFTTPPTPEWIAYKAARDAVHALDPGWENAYTATRYWLDKITLRKSG